MKKLTQAVFDDAPSWVKSAAVDSEAMQGRAFFYSIPKEDLCRDEIEHGGKFGIRYKAICIGSGYDTENWRESAINRGE